MQVLGQKKRVLCIDGGGIKGIFALYILAEMQFRAGVQIHQMFDLFVGTSIGGLMSLWFAMRKSARLLLNKILGVWKNSIFKPFAYGYFSTMKKILSLLFRGQVYEVEEFQRILRNQVFLQLTIEENLKQFLIVSCFKQENRIIPCIFHNFSYFQNNLRFQLKGLSKIANLNQNQLQFEYLQNFNNIIIWKIIRATSAAFPYFKPITIGEKQFFDGGFIFNSPTLVALQFLKKYGVEDTQIRMLSIGYRPKGQNIISIRGALEGHYIHNLFKNCLLFWQTIFIMKIIRNQQQLGIFMRSVQDNCLNVVEQRLQNNFTRIYPEIEIGCQLDSIDYDSISKILDKSEKQLIRLQMQNEGNIRINDLIRQFLNEALQQDIPSLSTPVRRIITRYQSYPQSYKELNNLYSGRDPTPEEIIQTLKSFKFPDIISQKQQKINLPTTKFLGLWYSVQNPIMYALAIGHFESIQKLQAGQILKHLEPDQHRWNLFHVAFANDEIVSLHYLLADYVINLNQTIQQFNDQSRNYIKIRDIIFKNNIYRDEINTLQDKLLNNKTSYIFSPDQSAQQFQLEYKSRKTNYYMILLTKKLNGFNFTWRAFQ